MGSRTGQVRRLGDVDDRRWFLLVRATLSLAHVSIALAIMPFRLAIRSGSRPLGRKSTYRVDDIVWAVTSAARLLPWRTMCLEKGLGCQRMLRSAGIDALLHYGARHHPETGALEAHAWVVVEGNAVIGGDEARGFALLATYPPE